MEHVKPRPHWATIHAAVAVFSEYSCRFGRRKRRLYSRRKRRLWSPKIIAIFGDMVAVPYFRFRQLQSPISATKTATIVAENGDYIVASVDGALGGNYGRFDSRFDSNSNRNARFYSVFDSKANGRFAGPYVLVSINAINRLWARLVLGWVTVYVRVNHLDNVTSHLGQLSLPSLRGR